MACNWLGCLSLHMHVIAESAFQSLACLNGNFSGLLPAYSIVLSPFPTFQDYLLTFFLIWSLALKRTYVHETQGNTEEIDHWLGGNENVKERPITHAQIRLSLSGIASKQTNRESGGNKNERRGEAQGEEENEMMLETLERRELRWIWRWVKGTHLLSFGKVMNGKVVRVSLHQIESPNRGSLSIKGSNQIQYVADKQSAKAPKASGLTTVLKSDQTILSPMCRLLPSFLHRASSSSFWPLLRRCLPPLSPYTCVNKGSFSED